MDLKVSRSDDGAGSARTIVAVTGFIDISNSQELVEVGTSALSSGDRLVLDLSAVEFMDSTGIGALVELDMAAQQPEQALEVVAVSDRVRRVLEITGLAERWSPAAEPGAV